MNKIFLLIIALLPLNLFAGEGMNSNCESIKDSTERRECVDLEKRKEAENNFKNFEENNQTMYSEDF